VSRPNPLGPAAAARRLQGVGEVILVGSGKGGVGKSTVACCLSLELRRNGFSTGLLDLDFHGASVPEYLSLRPPVSSDKDGLRPKTRGGLKVMSVGLFTGDNPVPMRGPDKQELTAQIFGLTNWGHLDFLVVDLPPSMGDELLTALNVFGEKASLLLVTTPSPASTEVVSRLRRLADREGVPILGAVLNMAYVGVGRKKVFPFGRRSAKTLESEIGSRLCAVVPLEPTVADRSLVEVLESRGEFAASIAGLAKQVRSALRLLPATRAGAKAPR